MDEVSGYGESDSDIPPYHPGDCYHALSDNVPGLPGSITARIKKRQRSLSPPSRFSIDFPLGNPSLIGLLPLIALSIRPDYLCHRSVEGPVFHYCFRVKDICKFKILTMCE